MNVIAVAVGLGSFLLGGSLLVRSVPQRHGYARSHLAARLCSATAMLVLGGCGFVAGAVAPKALGWVVVGAIPVVVIEVLLARNAEYRSFAPATDERWAERIWLRDVNPTRGLYELEPTAPRSLRQSDATPDSVVISGTVGRCRGDAEVAIFSPDGRTAYLAFRAGGLLGRRLLDLGETGLVADDTVHGRTRTVTLTSPTAGRAVLAAACHESEDGQTTAANATLDLVLSMTDSDVRARTVAEWNPFVNVRRLHRAPRRRDGA